ncbi:MAG TPA: polysaccharide deacetylase family protein [Firmicutes bacterium]|nr:polysaccharide deacetylase family protein [Bacillota bacterium]
MIIKRAKTFGFLMTGLAAVLMVGGVLFVWLGSDGGTAVSADPRALYGGTSETDVALMFNVYSGEEYIPGMLETLADYDVKATFFIGGCWAAKNESVLRLIAESGHEIGSHGYLHRDHSQMDVEANLEEMKVAHKMIKGICGSDVTLFAPPSGAYSAATLDAAESMGYKTILWSKDTIDWRDHDTALITSRATENAEGGDFILMHPTENTAEALPAIIDGIRAAGLNPGTVSDAL